MDYFKNADNVWGTGLTYIKYVVDTAREPFLILDAELNVISVNDSFYRFFTVLEEHTIGKKIYDLGNKQWDIPQLRALLENILPKNSFFNDFEVEHEFPLIGKKIILLNARIVFNQNDPEKTPLIILAMEDVTKQRLLDERMREYTKELEQKVAEKTTALEKKLLEGSKAIADRVEELEKLNDSMVGREIVIGELKKRIRDLEEKLEKAMKVFPDNA